MAGILILDGAQQLCHGQPLSEDVDQVNAPVADPLGGADAVVAALAGGVGGIPRLDGALERDGHLLDRSIAGAKHGDVHHRAESALRSAFRNQP